MCALLPATDAGQPATLSQVAILLPALLVVGYCNYKVVTKVCGTGEAEGY